MHLGVLRLEGLGLLRRGESALLAAISARTSSSIRPIQFWLWPRCGAASRGLRAAGFSSGQGGVVDDEAVPDVGGQDSLVCLVDLLGREDLDVRSQVMLGAEAEHIAGLLQAAD